MSRVGHFLRKLLLGYDAKGVHDEEEEYHRKEWREAIHENKNAIMRSSGAARISKNASEEALTVQKKAVQLLECVRDKTKAGKE